MENLRSLERDRIDHILFRSRRRRAGWKCEDTVEICRVGKLENTNILFATEFIGIFEAMPEESLISICQDRDKSSNVDFHVF